MQGFRPAADGGLALKNGRFYEFCKRAAEHPADRYVFVIDEINRGNLSKIFGELMLLIEADKRGPDWQVPLPYTEGRDKFYVPDNLYLLGLMNTADRSLAVVDYALRRRFAFFDLVPQFGSAKFAAHLTNNGFSKSMIELVRGRLGALNQVIEDDTTNLGPGFTIGHSFFCSRKDELLSQEQWYRGIIETEVVPLLKEYWFDSQSRVDDWRDRLLAGV